MKNKGESVDTPTRRRFLGMAGAAVLGTGAALVSKQGADGAEPAGKGCPRVTGNGSEKVRLAVVGGGFGAAQHWHEHPMCEVTAVTDLVKERRQALVNRYGCKSVFSSLEEMLEKAYGTFDAVAVFTDAPSHARHVALCMEAGKHVTCACPAALTLDDLGMLKRLVERTGLIYMMHESSYYRQPCMAARELYEAGDFGRLCCSEVEYYHPGICAKGHPLSVWQGKKSWRFGYPPMLYPTHSLGLLIGVTGERIVRVSCTGQRVGRSFPEPGENVYGNPFDNEMAIGVTNKGNICRFSVFWQVAAHGERGQWLGEKMSCYMAGSGGQPQGMMRLEGGYTAWEVPEYWKTDRLPKPMRHPSGHGGSAAFLAAEFIESVAEMREPAVDIYESIAMTAPGIVAHQSAMKGGVQLDVPCFDR